MHRFITAQSLIYIYLIYLQDVKPSKKTGLWSLMILVQNDYKNTLHMIKKITHKQSWVLKIKMSIRTCESENWGFTNDSRVMQIMHALNLLKVCYGEKDAREHVACFWDMKQLSFTHTARLLKPQSL